MPLPNAGRVGHGRSHFGPGARTFLSARHVAGVRKAKRTKMSALVRLGWRWDGAVEVRLCAVKNRAVSNRNCVLATRGGEPQNENDQSVTQIARVGGRRELDSVGVAGRAC